MQWLYIIGNLFMKEWQAKVDKEGIYRICSTRGLRLTNMPYIATYESS